MIYFKNIITTVYMLVYGHIPCKYIYITKDKVYFFYNYSISL